MTFVGSLKNEVASSSPRIRSLKWSSFPVRVVRSQSAEIQGTACRLFSSIYKDLRLAGFCDIVSSILLEIENPP